jgi:hypothetical protein
MPVNPARFPNVKLNGAGGKAFASGFSVDFERDGDFLTDAATTDW